MQRGSPGEKRVLTVGQGEESVGFPNDESEWRIQIGSGGRKIDAAYARARASVLSYLLISKGALPNFSGQNCGCHGLLLNPLPSEPTVRILLMCDPAM